MKQVLPRLLKPHKPGRKSWWDWRFENEFRVFDECWLECNREPDCWILNGEGAMSGGGGGMLDDVILELWIGDSFSEIGTSTFSKDGFDVDLFFFALFNDKKIFR